MAEHFPEIVEFKSAKAVFKRIRQAYSAWHEERMGCFLCKIGSSDWQDLLRIKAFSEKILKWLKEGNASYMIFFKADPSESPMDVLSTVSDLSPKFRGLGGDDLLKVKSKAWSSDYNFFGLAIRSQD